VTRKIAATGGDWCPPRGQPAFSRWREDVYGAGFLDFLSPTEAVWSFFAQSTAMLAPRDAVVIMRGNPKCASSGGASKVAAAAAQAQAKANLTIARAATTLQGLNNVSAASFDAGAGAAGLARGAGAYLSAKKSVANFSATSVANSLRNKTGGVLAG
jgi:hypothetical protein